MPRKHKRTRIDLPDGRRLEARHDGTWWVSRANDGHKLKLRVGPGEAHLMLTRAGITHIGGKNLKTPAARDPRVGRRVRKVQTSRKSLDNAA